MAPCAEKTYSLGDAAVFKTLERSVGVSQTDIHGGDARKKALNGHKCKFPFTRFPTRLSNSPERSQKVTNLALSDPSYRFAKAYGENGPVFSQVFEAPLKQRSMASPGKQDSRAYDSH